MNDAKGMSEAELEECMRLHTCSNPLDLVQAIERLVISHTALAERLKVAEAEMNKHLSGRHYDDICDGIRQLAQVAMTNEDNCKTLEERLKACEAWYAERLKQAQEIITKHDTDADYWHKKACGLKERLKVLENESEIWEKASLVQIIKENDQLIADLKECEKACYGGQELIDQLRADLARVTAERDRLRAALEGIRETTTNGVLSGEFAATEICAEIFSVAQAALREATKEKEES